MVWETIERPGYLGRHRDERYAEYSKRYGAGNWRLVWRMGSQTGGFCEATAVYGLAYYLYLQERADLLDWLVRAARDVYDDAPSNVASGLDYQIQETGRTHVQDIALRWAVLLHGREFQGSELIQIRATQGPHPLSRLLSPGEVPFHCPDWILLPALTGWWNPGSVEQWYQSNRLLQVQR